MYDPYLMIKEERQFCKRKDGICLALKTRHGDKVRLCMFFVCNNNEVVFVGFSSQLYCF